ncbi:mediator complex, subunit Med10 [Zopfochytrium polystomum]|nr:mediator complex, subunit Med10 [Zopfochytrium polystomum]
MSTSTPLEEAERKLEDALETLLKISITVANYQPESGPVLQRRINEYVTQLADLDVLKEDLDVRVPLSVLEAIDEGKNPDQLTRDLVQILVDKNQKTNGRVRAMQDFSKELTSELQRNYPSLLEEYRELTAPASSSSS